MAEIVPEWMFLEAQRRQTQHGGPAQERSLGFLGGLAQGARQGLADFVGAVAKFSELVEPESGPAGRLLYKETRGPQRPLSPWGKAGAFLGRTAAYAPLAIGEAALAGALGAPIAIGAGLGMLTGASLGDPDTDATSRIANGLTGLVLGAVFPAGTAKVAVPTEGIVKRVEPLRRFAAKTLAGALSGGIIGGVWLEDDPEVLFSPAGAIAGAAISAAGARYGDALARRISRGWDVVEAKLLGGLGPTVKPLAREAEQVKYHTAQEIEQLVRLTRRLPKHSREFMGRAIDEPPDAPFHMKRPLPVEEYLARQIVELTHNIYKRLVDLQMLDPTRVPPERFVAEPLTVAEKMRGYLPRVYSGKKARERMEALGFGRKRKDKGTIAALRASGSSVRARGRVVTAKDWLKSKKRNPYGLTTKDLTLGDTLYDEHGRPWTVLNMGKGKRPRKVLWRDYTLREQWALGREWDVLYGLAQLGREHAEHIARGTLFKRIAEQEGLVLADAKKAKQLGFKRVPETFTEGGFREFGALAGKWVRPDVYDALRAYAAMRKPPERGFVRALASLNSLFKKGFLGLNLSSYRNAFLGNIALSFLYGYNPVAVLRRGARALRSRVFRQALRDAGVTLETHGFDIGDIVRGLPKQAEEPSKLVQQAIGLLKRGEEIAHKAAGELIRPYGAIDALFKAGLIDQLTSKGVSIQDAVREANRVFVSSELLPKRVQGLRDTIMPFITFYYRFLENALPEIARNPHRLLVLMGLIDALQMAGYIDTYGPKKWRAGKEYEREVAPEWKRTMPGGVAADYIRTPWGMFSTSFLPTNLPVSLASNDRLPNAVALWLQNPVLSFAYTLMTGRDPSTDAPITAIEAAVRSMPMPLPRKALHLLAQRDMLPDPLVLWFNTTGSHPDASPVETWEAIWDTFLPAYSKLAPEYDFKRAVQRIQAALRDDVNVRRSRAKRSASRSYRAAQKERVKGEAEKAAEELRRLFELRRAALGR